MRSSPRRPGNPPTRLSLRLIRLCTAMSGSQAARGFSQVANVIDPPRTALRRLGKRVGETPQAFESRKAPVALLRRDLPEHALCRPLWLRQD
ncbi:hypothetical protein Adu01nite_37740 [Paractinoplanes durhamensis]|uniref:Uncharacterized protein n=1 Tax=Paractinoplanes durhamensis TaxID=113563 RepID=A0ABQ3YY27_9ACTN|nr:hypothetical protein Adu01nite_37740 [Actinoplanes durhamensis]